MATKRVRIDAVYRTSAQRRDICRQHGRWPEVGVRKIAYVAGMRHLYLTCGHVTARSRTPARDTRARVVCDQCAAEGYRGKLP